MIAVVSLAALTLWASIATIEYIHRDGYAALPFDPSR
jgi:hypothetical protein